MFLDGIGAGVGTCDGNLRRVLRGNSVILFHGTHFERRKNHVSQFVPYYFAHYRTNHNPFRLRGASPDLTAPPAAIRQGVCFVAGDRNADSIASGLSVRENTFLNPRASGRGPFAWRTPADEAAEAARLGERVGLQPNDPVDDPRGASGVTTSGRTDPGS